jgi:hypothetical protein
MPDPDDDLCDDFEPQKPFWRCEECGYEDHNKPMPKDRDKWYKDRAEGKDLPKCPECKSRSLTPSGY